MSERLGDDHDLDRAAADPADIFGQCGAEDAEFVREATPDVGLPTRSRLRRGATLLEVVSGRQELAQPVAQQFLFLAQVEVHLMTPIKVRVPLWPGCCAESRCCRHRSSRRGR